MSNNTPPKEIYLLGQDLEFMGMDDLYLIDASLTDVLGGQIKYLSEESVKEMLAEKDKEIDSLKKDENLDSIISEIEYIKGLYDNKRYTNAELSFNKLTEQIKDYIGL